MKLALYLPNFRDKVTVTELDDLTSLAEELDFDSVWTLDRIVVPEASDREELQHSFGMMDEFPKALPVSSRGEWFQGWPLIPWLAAKTTKVRIGMSITDTPYRAPGVLAAAVVGRPDAEWGEAVVAFVVAADGAAPPPVEDLDRTCLDYIARFKRPKDYRFVDTLPTNNYGKVVKRELRDRLRQEPLDDQH